MPNKTQTQPSRLLTVRDIADLDGVSEKTVRRAIASGLLQAIHSRVYLVLDEEDTKTHRALEFELPKDVVRLLEKHLATRSPELCQHGSPWLFPRRDDRGPIVGNALSSRLRKRLRKEIGLEMNAHLFRHFAVMIWLDANPGGYEVARRLLGHSELSHTIALYSGFEATTATRAFADLMATKQRQRP